MSKPTKKAAEELPFIRGIPLCDGINPTQYTSGEMPTDLGGTVIMVPTTEGSMPMDHRMFHHMMESFLDDDDCLVSQEEADEIIAEQQFYAEMEAAAAREETAREDAGYEQDELDA